MKVRDSDGPDQAIDLGGSTYEEIHEKITRMLYIDGFNLKPVDELKSVISKLQALNIKGLQIAKISSRDWQTIHYSPHGLLVRISSISGPDPLS